MFAGNEAVGHYPGGLSFAGSPDDHLSLTRCTFYANTCEAGFGHASGVNCEGTGQITVENTIISFGLGGCAVACGGGVDVGLVCCDVYGNQDGHGDWVGCIEGMWGEEGNICEDPLFCDAGGGSFHLQEESPCAPYSPPNEECDLVGARTVGCEGASGVADRAGMLARAGDILWVPNPFTQRTQLTHALTTGRPGEVRVTVHDTAGRLVWTSLRSSAPGGKGVFWDGADFLGRPAAGGIYLLDVSDGSQRIVRSVVLLK